MNTEKTNINELLHGIADDNRNSFNMFYRIYYEQVFRFSYYFLKDKEACKEIISDIFFSIWQSRKKISELTNIDAYLYTVTKNEVSRYLNRKTKHHSVSLDEIPIQIEETREISPEEQLQYKEIEKLLAQVISELPEKCRIIFMMARQEGLKPKEIANILSINESTVRVQMKIAIEKIISRIQPHFPDLIFSVLFTLLDKMTTMY